MICPSSPPEATKRSIKHFRQHKYFLTFIAEGSCIDLGTGDVMRDAKSVIDEIRLVHVIIKVQIVQLNNLLI